MDCSRKFERTFTWSVTKDQAESYMGPMSDEEFDHYCRVFEEVFKNEYIGTFEILKDDWDEFSTWVD
ncbi:hypothetical protein N9H63_00900 [bacterium]|nr:hypothetical protein [bacterium]